MPTPSAPDTLSQRLLAALRGWYGPAATVQERVALPLGGQTLVAGVAVLGSLDARPRLAVLVLDASAPFGPQVAAARQLVAAGVPSCWLVEPTLRTVTVTTEAGRYQSFNQHETLRDPATGIELELARLFG